MVPARGEDGIGPSWPAQGQPDPGVEGALQRSPTGPCLQPSLPGPAVALQGPSARRGDGLSSARERPPAAQPIVVHYSDPWLLVVDKPSGLLCQPGLGPELADSLVTRLQVSWPELRLVHRLDRDTSGLLLLARDSDTHRQLSLAFAERQVQKRYQARVFGRPVDAAGSIAAPIGKRCHRPPLYGVAEGGRPSLTHWQQLGRHRHGCDLSLQPVTGRSHQLRVHLLAIGHPILGDPLYGQPFAARLCSRLCLHATGLAFHHPLTGQWLDLRSEARFPAPAPGAPGHSGAEGLAR